jgi:predicted DNA-binding protein (MmcQ/YjbR family)
VARNTFEAVRSGYHSNERHWNSVTLDGSIPSSTIAEWVDDSDDLVVEGLSRRVREKFLTFD